MFQLYLLDYLLKSDEFLINKTQVLGYREGIYEEPWLVQIPAGLSMPSPIVQLVAAATGTLFCVLRLHRTSGASNVAPSQYLQEKNSSALRIPTPDLCSVF